jgi:glycosyltransferase involved in cell wall biosynthesis
MSHPSSAPEPAVGILLGSRRIGGTERQVAYLAEGLAERGIRTVLFFGESRKALPPDREMAFPEMVPAIHLGADRAVRWRWDKGFLLARLLRRHRLNVLHMFNLGAIELGRLALRFRPDVAGIAAMRGLKFAQDPATGAQLRRALSPAFHLSCNSPAIADGLAALTGTPVEEVTVVRNGITIPPPTAPAAPSKRVLFAGTLGAVKDPATFARAMVHAGKKVPLQVRIVGDGPLEGEVRRLLAEGLPADSWEMMGRLPPEAVPYADAAVVVSSSLREGGSNTLLEAMAHGVAIVATDAGANREMVLDSGAGKLVPVGDAEAMGDALVELLVDTEARTAMGAGGRHYVEKNFGMARMVDEHVALYREVLESRGRRGP